MFCPSKKRERKEKELNEFEICFLGFTCIPQAIEFNMAVITLLLWKSSASMDSRDALTSWFLELILESKL